MIPLQQKEKRIYLAVFYFINKNYHEKTLSEGTGKADIAC